MTAFVQHCQDSATKSFEIHMPLSEIDYEKFAKKNKVNFKLEKIFNIKSSSVFKSAVKKKTSKKIDIDEIIAKQIKK